MEQNIGSLTEALSQYKTQLAQIQLAVAASAPGPDRNNLQLLQSDIYELIELTNENLISLHKQQSGECSSANSTKEEVTVDENDPFAAEYALFKAELQDSDVTNINSSNEPETTPEVLTVRFADIKEELAALQGMKCQAPYSHHWGETSYHNALVYCIEPTGDLSSMDQIQVRVMFTNPFLKAMLPCPFYLEGECKFPDEKCHYSHGELVNLSSLKEYREPDFKVVRPSLRVLVKGSDKLWHGAVVTSINSNNRCDVKLESNGTKMEVDLHDILPLGEEAELSSSSSSGDDDEDIENDRKVDPLLIEQSLLTKPGASALGSWEKHTKGIGSRLMARMGYVVGTGLGKRGEGMIEPVEAVIFPPGKSLDHCMELKEKAGADENMFKVEKRLKRLQRKEEQQRKKQYEREKQRTNVFDFINRKLGDIKGNTHGTTSTTSKSTTPTGELKSQGLKAETSRGLNVVGFQVGEEIRRAERDLARLRESLSRHTQGSVTYKLIANKLRDKQGEVLQLQASERSIEQERTQRKDRKKLSIF